MIKIVEASMAYWLEGVVENLKDNFGVTADPINKSSHSYTLRKDGCTTLIAKVDSNGILKAYDPDGVLLYKRNVDNIDNFCHDLEIHFTRRTV